MKVLVTGANGFVGSHITEKLIEKGHFPVCLVRKTSDLKWIKELPAEFRYGDLTDGNSLNKALEGVEAVINTAGVLRARTSGEYFACNRDAAAGLASAALERRSVIKSFVHLSSQAAMGPSSSKTLKKLSEPENPLTDYGKSKLAGEKAVADLLNGKMPCAILRPGAVYGPRDKDIFIFFQLVAKGFRPKPFRERSFQLVFVKDVAEAAVRAVERTDPSAVIYPLADPTPYSWSEVGSEIASSVGKSTMALPLPDLAFRIAAFFAEISAGIAGKAAVLNNQKIDELLQDGWLMETSSSARELGLDFTKLKIGAKITYNWYKENRWF